MRSFYKFEQARNTNRRGLTLIELVVVLTILVALGAILVPVVGNALTRSHLATCLTNFPEVTKMLVQAQAERGTLGDGWTNPAQAQVTNETNPSGVDQFTNVGTLTADKIKALADLGMEKFSSVDPTRPNVTFDNGVNPTAVAALVADTTDVVVLTPAQAADLYLPAATGNQQYVFFAIDKSWSLLGELTPEPPVHFGDTPGALPHECYSRWGAIFLVDEASAAAADTGDGSAEFKRVTVHISNGAESAFETGDNHSAVYWQEIHE